MKKLMLYILVFLMASSYGLVIQKVFFPNVTKLEKVKPVFKDTLPLENGEEIYLELIEDKKMISMKYKTYQYLMKGWSKARARKVEDKLEALFLRLEDK